MPTDRREFLAAVAATTVACGGHQSPWRFFTVAEARTVEAVCARIIPADRDPGATEARVLVFLDRQLTGFYKSLQPAYREGIASIDRAAVAQHGAPFANLAPPQQDAVLHELEKKRQPFFDLLVSHTMQGYYGSPRHGGNRDAVSWKMLGVPYPPIRGRV